MNPDLQRAATQFVAEIVSLIMAIIGQKGQRWISVGTIQPDWSLLIHEDNSVFPPGQYAGPDVYALQQTETATVPGTSDPSNGLHQHTLPVTLRQLGPGDRVLVAWLEGENDPIVIHRLVPIFAPTS